ncbi:hypothetical protein ON010_g6873 [Phytophthora cinnamomi]|nr:hypothetical protein ON010_g6873 [Phytophthora cinnamomi]
MDDTSVYGQDCGFTNPNGTPQPIPTDGKAKFSRGLIHVGPCEIWLDDNKVLSEDDCYSKYGNPNQDITTVFPVDYSSCANGGCKEMRFYWLGFQGLSDKTVWQSYKNCIPLTGSGGGSSNSTSTTPSTSTSQTSQASSLTGAQTPSTGDSKTPSSSHSKTPSSSHSKTPSSGDSKTPSSSGKSATPAPASKDSPSTDAPTTQGSSADTPKVTTAPSFNFN